MAKNELLEEKIEETIKEARYKAPEKEKNRRPIFYLIVVFLVTLSVLFSLFRFL